MKILSTLFYLIVCVAAIGFIFLNSDKATVDYYWGTIHWPVGLVVVVGFVVGLFLGHFLGSLKGRSIMKRKMMNKFQATINAAPSDGSSPKTK